MRKVALAAERFAGENRVHVPEHQYALALAATRRGHEMPGAVHALGHVDPAGLHADTREFGREEIAHGAHTGDVLGGALDVHHALEQGLGRARAQLCGSGDGGFLRTELCTAYRRPQAERDKAERTDTTGHGRFSPLGRRGTYRTGAGGGHAP